MPQDNPGSLTDEEYVDVIAYMLSVGGMPAGEADLRPDPEDLARVVIEQQPFHHGLLVDYCSSLFILSTRDPEHVGHRVVALMTRILEQPLVGLSQ